MFFPKNSNKSIVFYLIDFANQLEHKRRMQYPRPCNGHIYYSSISIFCKYKHDFNHIWKCCFRNKFINPFYLSDRDPPYQIIIDDSCVLHLKRAQCRWNILSIELNPQIRSKTLPLTIEEANLLKTNA